MPSKDTGEDVAFLLYLVPVVLGIIYGAYEIATAATAASGYLIVSKSPYLFLISVAAVCFAVIVEVRSTNVPERNGVIQANTSRLQILAVVVLIVSFFGAVGAGGYNLTTGAILFIDGRYAFIYAFFLIGISLLLSPKQVLGNLKVASVPDILGLLLMVAGPVLFWAGLKVHLNFAISAIGGLVVGIIGFVLLFMPNLLTGKKQPQQSQQKQSTPSGASPPKVSS